MNKRIYLTEGLYIDFELSAVQLLVIVLMFMVMFVIPVYAYERLNAPPVQAEEVQVTPVPGAETYTADALGQGQVAGVSTSIQDNYITIPVLELQFDTTLNDPDSIPILLGAILGTISAGLFIYLLLDTLFGKPF